MKFRIVYITGLVALAIALFSCHKTTIGYLITENASYQIDSMQVKSILDTTAPIIIANPLYDMYLGFGFPPDLLLEMGIFPTIETDAGEDYKRNKLEQPWSGTAIEGIDGTAPIFISVKSVATDVGNADKMKSELSIRGNGMLSLPLKHNVPPGRYQISLSVKNEGFTKSLDNIFTIIIN